MKKQIKEQSCHKKEKIIFATIFFILTLISIVFGILSWSGLYNVFIQNHFIALSIIWSIVIFFIFSVAIWGILKRKEVLIKSLLSLFILLSFFVILIFALQRTGFFFVIKDAESLQKYLENAGVWMPLAYVLLQFLQVIVLPIPSVVSTVAGVALFGALYATIYSLMGILLGSIIAFIIGRKVGYKAVAWLVGEDALNKWQKKLKGKDNILLTLMFILPMFPDDLLCFIAGLSSMTTKYFLIMISICRLITVTSTCFSFNFIPFNTWWGLLIWAVLIVTMIRIFIFIYKNMEKILRILKKRLTKVKRAENKRKKQIL